jgi:hypothetical protein
MLASYTTRTYSTLADATALCRGGSRSKLDSNERETPRGKPVASSSEILRALGSGDPETPRGKPVASTC